MTSINPDNPTPNIEASALPAPAPKARNKGRKRTPYRHIERPGIPLLLTVPEAAETLRMTVEALRARLRRAQVVGPDGNVTAPLRPGIVGVKVGANTWRVRFDSAK